jgi:multicomponent Na+:H+ antiporter subunit E
MDNSDPAPANVVSGIIVRGGCFLGFWLIIAGADPADLPAGAVAVVAATWVSLRLMPLQQWSIRPVKFARYVLRFLRQSIVAGIDVARLALNPRMPLNPGFVIYHPQLPPGVLRDEFCAVSSLLPGTLPSGPAETSGLVIHCLDVTQPVLAQLAAEEAAFVEAFGGNAPQ